MAIAAERIRTISVTKMHPVIGAEIGGVDLCRPLDAETLRQIKDAWHEHSVLLFRGQNLSEDDQRRFASYFGPVAKRVPPKPGATGVGDAPAWNDMMLVSDKLDADGKPLGTLGHGEMWFHTDKCYHRRPHRASFLYGIEIPSAGGVWMIRSEMPPGPSSLCAPVGGVPVKSIRSSWSPLHVSPAATTHGVSSTPARRIVCVPMRLVPSTESAGKFGADASLKVFVVAPTT